MQAPNQIGTNSQISLKAGNIISNYRIDSIITEGLNYNIYVA
jgi:hypothetical protein